MSGRVYVRKFDWDEAVRLRASGLTLQAVASQLGVSVTAVQLACDPRLRAVNELRVAEYQRRGRCRTCGGRCSRNASGPQGECRACAYKRQATTVRPKSLRCWSCKVWKPDTDFPWNRAEAELRRGRHGTCRVCQTILRTAYRQRRRVPCVNCGQPRSHPGERSGKGVSCRDTGLCRECYQAQRRGA